METIKYKFIRGRPLIPIVVSNVSNDFELETYGLADTGADCCLFPDYVALLPGYNLTAGVKKGGTTADGRQILTYAHKVHLHLAHVDSVGKYSKILTFKYFDVQFCESDDDTPLLGNSEFLGQFESVCFLYPESVVRLSDIRLQKC